MVKRKNYAGSNISTVFIIFFMYVLFLFNVNILVYKKVEMLAV